MLKIFARGRVLPGLFFVSAALLAVGCASSNQPPDVERDQQRYQQDVAGAPSVQPVANDKVPLLIRVADNVSPAKAKSLFQSQGCTVVQQIPPNTGTLWVLDAPKTQTPEQWTALMQKQPGVTSAEIDLTRLYKIPEE